ncbi:hypothetical protein EGM51_08595 [Verrucomicrobia bacterium S94]|nr:hypothetical protein EGM51_08595 [Verrucomicrobia bacterium S94]
MKTQINMKLPNILFSMLAASVLLGLPVRVSAGEEPPERMTYQGFVVDGNGTVLGNSAPENFEIIFRIWTAQSGGILKWSEQQTVTVDKGYFSVLLGEGTEVNGELRPALSSVFTGSDASERFMGISVKGIGSGGSDADILPRLQLVTVPYAFMAHHVAPDSISGANIADNTVSSADILSNTINSSDIQNESITYQDLAPNSVYASEIATGAVGTSEVQDNSLTATDLAANAVGASEIAANAVGNSELQSDLTLSGSIGINQRYVNTALTIKPGVGDNYSRWVAYEDGTYTLFQNADGLMGICRRVDYNSSGLEVLRLSCTTPNSGTDDWSLRIDTDDAGGLDEDLFFYLNGSLKGWVDADGSGFKGNSDARLKQDITDMDSVLNRAVQLQPRLYRFKDNPNGELQLGFIAQEVQPYFPEIVDDGEEYLGLSYGRVGVIAIGAIKELNTKVETLKAENRALKDRLDALESRILSLEQ